MNMHCTRTRLVSLETVCCKVVETDSPVAFWYVQGHRNGTSWVRTSGSSKTIILDDPTYVSP